MREPPRATKKKKTAAVQETRKTAGKTKPVKSVKTAKVTKPAKTEVKSPELIPVFEELSQLLRRYAPPFIILNQSSSRLDLYGPKEVTLGRKIERPYFASVVIQKGYVGFYFMPIYVDPERFRKVLSSDLLRLLKGKSCFHIKELHSPMKKHIHAALELGAKAYRDRDWI